MTSLTKKAPFGAYSFFMGGIPQLVITSGFMEVIYAFQNLDYINELKQRLNELKKINNIRSF